MLVVRRVGIAIGSVAIAYLAFSWFGWFLFGQSWPSHPLVPWIVLILGGLIYRDILSRETGPSTSVAGPDPPDPARPVRLRSP